MLFRSEGYLENRLAASWLRKHYADKQALVITLQPWITSYYTDLPHLIFRLPVGYVGQQTFPCEDIDCIFRYTKAFDPNIDILLIRDNYTHAAGLNDFNAQNFGVGFLQNFLKEKQHYVLLDRVEQEKSWVEIYQYSPNFNWQQNLPKN